MGRDFLAITRPLLRAMNLEVARFGAGIPGEQVCKLDQTSARRIMTVLSKGSESS